MILFGKQAIGVFVAFTIFCALPLLHGCGDNMYLCSGYDYALLEENPLENDDTLSYVVYQRRDSVKPDTIHYIMKYVDTFIRDVGYELNASTTCDLFAECAKMHFNTENSPLQIEHVYTSLQRHHWSTSVYLLDGSDTISEVLNPLPHSYNEYHTVKTKKVRFNDYFFHFHADSGITRIVTENTKAYLKW